MIANFYKVARHSYKNPVLLASKNIDCIPLKGTHIEFSGQNFLVDSVIFILDTCEYRIAVVRV